MSGPTEILIVKNPIFFKDVAKEAFERLIPDGSWIPLVFTAIEKVVNEHFFALCELDWDYLRETEKVDVSRFEQYKSLFYRGLNDEQIVFVRKVADEMEEEIRLAAEEALRSKDEEVE